MLNRVQMDHPHPYPPRKTPFTSRFWEALAEGKLLATKGVDQELPVIPPRNFDPVTWSKDIEWVELSGAGTLYSITSIHAAPAAFRAHAPYQVAIVDLDEGPRIATLFLGPVDTPLDTRVEIVALEYTDDVSFAARPVQAR